ncbi:MAG: tRNA 2-thiouridine(34) synthase MnmA [Clostridia bacterium]|nr:tRNA 2-thiouridine(34) synthase MnmA [Clostridia bacterium]
MTKVIVGMSGGVDSAAAAVLLKKQGYEVTGVTVRTWEADGGDDSRCCEIDDAARAARRLGIRHVAPNAVADFEKYVTGPFVDCYIRGLTPSPCVECNRYVKWARMLRLADELGAEYVATGHYASVLKLPNGRYTVGKAACAEKDQSYMLWRLTQEQLSRTLFPLGGMSKADARRIAEEAGLNIASKPESQDICFVPDGDYAGFIEKNAGERIPGEGSFIDGNGCVLGVHRGIIHYTVGQRRGLRLPLGYPAYVKEIRADDNTVVVAPEASLYCGTVFVRDVNFMSIPCPEPGEKISCRVKIRYRHPAQESCLERCPDPENGGPLFRIDFAGPVRAPAPGQSAVFYDGQDRVVGGGVIVAQL